VPFTGWAGAGVGDSHIPAGILRQRRHIAADETTPPKYHHLFFHQVPREIFIWARF
jgi:hypothetical protein